MKIPYRIIVVAKEIDGGTASEFENISKLNRKKFTLRFYLFRQVRNQNFKKYIQFFNSSYSDNKRFSLQNLFLFVKDIYRSCSIISREKPDLLLTLNLYSSATVTLAMKIFFRRIPIVCLINNDLSKEIDRKQFYFFRLLVYKSAQYVLNRVSRILFPSQGLASAQQKKFGFKADKITVIHGGVDTNLINKLREKAISKTTTGILTGNNFKIFTAGRLEPQKDYPTIFKAFELLLRKQPDSRLFILGDGSLKKDLKVLAQELNIVRNVCFVGWKKNVFSFLKFADLFVFSSFYEGLGYVLLESMAMKIPVISTDTPYGPSEILENGKFGFLIPIGDYREMADKMELLITDKLLLAKYSTLAYQRSKQFGLRDHLKRYEKVIEKIIKY